MWYLWFSSLFEFVHWSLLDLIKHVIKLRSENTKTDRVGNYSKAGNTDPQDGKNEGSGTSRETATTFSISRHFRFLRCFWDWNPDFQTELEQQWRDASKPNAMGKHYYTPSEVHVQVDTAAI
jgi:hypothetical protein